ncbi:MAG: 3-hydroxyacyl-ACP dehydratase FabZ [Chloroflexota bacterium]|nr:3-hydroxyacyl-ACP dehydratase FabZ [Chloroflexota bacterium]
MLEAEEIQAIIPHRYPFLLVDRIIELEYGKRAVGLKNVSVNEPFFQGHFPGMPLMPGVLQVEALAQVGAVAILGVPENRGKLAYFAGIDGVRFRRPVRPGDQLTLEVVLERVRSRIGVGSGTARVGDEVTCQGRFTFALGDMPAGT